jgi:hypothetical protein
METVAPVVYNAVRGPSVLRRLRPRPVYMSAVFMRGGLAQLGEHYVRNVGVGGSTPLPSTTVVDHL